MSKWQEVLLFGSIWMAGDMAILYFFYSAFWKHWNDDIKRRKKEFEERQRKRLEQ